MKKILLLIGLLFALSSFSLGQATDSSQIETGAILTQAQVDSIDFLVWDFNVQFIREWIDGDFFAEHAYKVIVKNQIGEYVVENQVNLFTITPDEWWACVYAGSDAREWDYDFARKNCRQQIIGKWSAEQAVFETAKINEMKAMQGTVAVP